MMLLFATLEICMFISTLSGYGRDKIPLAIGGIFEKDSVGLFAFTMSVKYYNADRNENFELTPRIETIDIANDTDQVVQLICELNKAGVVAIYFGQFTSNNLMLNAISSTAQALRIPIFLPTTTPSLIDDFTGHLSSVIHLKPRIEEAVAHLILYSNWTSFTYLCDSAEGLYRFELMNSYLESNQVDDSKYEIDLRFISNMERLSNDLRNMDRFLKSKEEKLILIDLDVMRNYKFNKDGYDVSQKLSVQSVMDAIVRLGMNRKEYSYLIIGIGVEGLDLDRFLHSGVSVRGFRILNNRKEIVKRFIADWKSLPERKAMPLSDREILSKTANIAASMNDAVRVLTQNSNKIFQTNSQFKRNIMGINENFIRNRNQGLLDNANCFQQYENLNYSDPLTSVRREIIKELSVIDAGIFGLTGNLHINKKGLRSNFELVVSVMNSSKGLEDVGMWSNSKGMNFRETQLTTNYHKTHTEYNEKISDRPLSYRLFDPHVIINETKFDNIFNRKLRVVTIINQPMTIRRPNGELDGFCIDLLRELSKMVNFTYEVYLVPDGKFGMRMPEKEKEEEIEVELPGNVGSKTVKKMKRKIQKWSGLIGEILNGNADLVVAPFTINHDRAQVLDFTEPFHTFGLSMMISKPGKQKPGIFSFLHPLNYDLWFSILLAFISVSLGLYTISIISPYEWSYDKSKDLKLSHEYSILNSTWCAFAAFVQQGVEYMPRSSGARILSSIWWFITLILIAYYTANLTAFLTVSKRISPINEWKDLLKAGVEYGTVKSGSSNIFFDNTKIEPFKSMGEYMKNDQSVFVDTVHKGVERVLNSSGKYVFILESPMNNYHNSIEPCSSMMAGSPFGSHGYGVAMAKRSPLKKKMNQAVLTLAEAHKINHLYKKWWVERSQCDPDDVKTSPSALSLINVAGVFFILLAGLLIAICATFAEFLFAIRRSKKVKIFS